MISRTQLGIALIAVSLVAFTVPALVPVEPMRWHDTGAGTTANASELDEEGYRIVAYENLSERGQELYVTALRNDGEYRVPVGDGASDFQYPTDGELGDVENHRERNRLRYVVIERPADADLPPADEPRGVFEYAERGEREINESELERRRAAVERYDLVQTRTATPPLTSPQHLARLLAVVLGVLSLGVGGYLVASK